ncbi:glycoside hydrolase family 172 protein [Fimbriimonas ginsengisoli]|uniref:DUF2961 domain-containing protein n=1 Tax=Fimbriimonas ginsengisoli Gsoil 348 TaxID=661478 RepID=A0A068NRV2_FIMGI|nr:glycoside hydrolase family 172 protein [Fimbriimonas ginsengisoli]AIE86166.1 hypothetical protein OP10G_2798 [Fimbriimonas ginsengisoli Gsoil 348]
MLGSIVLAVAALVLFQQGLEDLTRLRDVRSQRSSSSSKDFRTSNVDFRFIKPGESLTLLDAKGPGTVRRIWLTVLPSEPAYSRLMTIRIYWDGEESPSVESPLGDFFGVGHGIDAPFESAPVRASADGKARSCVWAMPFRKSARITVTNDGTQATWGFYYMVDWECGRVNPTAPYFHASYRQQFPCRPGNYVIADLRGNGHYVGTVLSVRSTSPGWWGEGDDFFSIDGERDPSLRGTGLEDYFGEAWGLHRGSGLYSGVPVLEDMETGARATAYRWHIPDPVRFRRSLKVEIEHKGVAFGADGKDLGNNNERADEYSSTAFWYQMEPHAPFPPMPSGPDRLPFDYRNFVEMESLAGQVTTSTGKVETAKVNGLRGNAELEWLAPQDGEELRVPFTVKQAGLNQLYVLGTFRWDGGLAEFLVDGQRIGKASFYSAGYDMHREITFPFWPLSAGAHVLTVRCVGKDPASQGRWFGLDGMIVQPLRR